MEQCFKLTNRAKGFLLFVSFLWGPFGLRAGDTLTVDQCRQLAVQSSPVQQRKAMAESLVALQNDNLKSNNLPHISIGAQGTWQSAVFGLPIESPLFKIPAVPKDQYKLTLDASERLWDGNSDKYTRQQRALERDLTVAQSDVDAFQVRETVTDLYFKTLLLQESEAVLLASLDDLQRRLRQIDNMIKEGVALRSTADQVRIQVLKTEQQIYSTRADKVTLLKILGVWIGRPQADFGLKTAANQVASPAGLSSAGRPEYRLFELQQRNFDLNKEMLRLRTQPRFDAFLQGGLGRPNPFNFFETGFKPFLLVGLRAIWTPIDWGNKSREAQMLDLQSQNIGIQRQAFDQRLAAANLKDEGDAAKYRAQLSQDDAIITLQDDIIKRADTQVKEGVMTATDYLTQLNIMTQARLTRKMHEIQAVNALELLKARQPEVNAH
jgi:outer membrane protein TolC